MALRSVHFHEASDPGTRDIRRLQQLVRRRVLRLFRRRELLDEPTVANMLTCQVAGGFSIDASVRIYIALALVAYPAARAREVLRAFRDFMTTAPDEIMGIALLWNSLDSEELPAAARNVPVAVLAAAYAGDPAAGEAALRPLREVDEPLFDLSGTLPFVEAQRLFDAD